MLPSEGEIWKRSFDGLIVRIERVDRDVVEYTALDSKTGYKRAINQFRREYQFIDRGK